MTPIYMYVIFGGCRELAPGPTALNAIMVGSVLPALFSDLPSNPNLPDTPELAIAQQHYNDLAQQVRGDLRSSPFRWERAMNVRNDRN